MENGTSRRLSQGCQAAQHFSQVVAQGPTEIPDRDEMSAALASVLPTEATALTEMAGSNTNSSPPVSQGSSAEAANASACQPNGGLSQDGRTNTGSGGGSWSGWALWPLWGTIDALKWAGQTVNERAVAPVVRYASPMGWMESLFGTVKGLTPQRARDLARVVGNATFNAAGLTQTPSGRCFMTANGQATRSFASAVSSPAGRQFVLDYAAGFVKVAEALDTPEAKDAIQQGAVVVARLMDLLSSRHTKIFLQDLTNALCRAVELANSSEATVLIAELTANVVHALEMEHIAENINTSAVGAGEGGRDGEAGGKERTPDAHTVMTPASVAAPVSMTEGLGGGSVVGPWEAGGGGETSLFTGGGLHLDGGKDYQEAIALKFTNPSTPLRSIPIMESHKRGEMVTGADDRGLNNRAGRGGELGLGGRGGDRKRDWGGGGGALPGIDQFSGGSGKDESQSVRQGTQRSVDACIMPGVNTASSIQGTSQTSGGDPARDLDTTAARDVNVFLEDAPLPSNRETRVQSCRGGVGLGPGTLPELQFPPHNCRQDHRVSNPLPSTSVMGSGEVHPLPRTKEEDGGVSMRPGQRIRDGRAVLPRFAREHFEKVLARRPRALQQEVDPQDAEGVDELFRQTAQNRRRELGEGVSRRGGGEDQEEFAREHGAGGGASGGEGRSRRTPPSSPGWKGVLFFVVYTASALYGLNSGIGAVRGWVWSTVVMSFGSRSMEQASISTGITTLPLHLALPAVCRNPISGVIMEVQVTPWGACITEGDDKMEEGNGAKAGSWPTEGATSIAACAASFRTCVELDVQPRSTLRVGSDTSPQDSEEEHDWKQGVATPVSPQAVTDVAKNEL